MDEYPAVSEVWSTATFAAAFNLNGATVIVDSGSSILVDGDYTNAYGGHVTVNGTFTVDGNANLNTSVITVNSGGTFTAKGLTNLNYADIVINGGTVDLQGTVTNNNGAVIDFNGNPKGVLKVDTSSQLSSVEAITIKNFAAGDIIEVASTGSGSLTTTYSNGVLTVANSSGTTVATFNISEASGYSFTPTASYVNGYLVIACFLAGTQISTERGTTSVEKLHVGDTISCYKNDGIFSQVVKWVGTASVVVRPELPDDAAGYPIRVLKDAISDNVPNADMLITAEHCLYFDGKFIPARMLVNGKSVFYDKTITTYDYYHVETEEHSVIMADGMLTESYLDTGNRKTFRSAGNIVYFGSNPKSWERDAAAALTVDRGTVEPLYRRIAARAEFSGIVSKAEPTVLVDEPDIHLVSACGKTIRKMRSADNNIMFMIPSGITQVRIVSRSSRPCDTVGPFVDDRRQLGILVGKVTLFDTGATNIISSYLTEENLDGWYSREAAPCRWTDGSAVLPLGARKSNSIGILSVEVLSAGPYHENKTKQYLEQQSA